MKNVMRVWVFLAVASLSFVSAESTFESFYKKSASFDIDWTDVAIDLVDLDFGSAIMDIAKTFTTSVVTDVAVNYVKDTVVNVYKYSNSAELSKNMITLPLPRNTNGSALYESAIKILKDFNKTLPMSNEINQKIMKKGLKELQPRITEAEYKKGIELYGDKTAFDIADGDIALKNVFAAQQRYYVENGLSIEDKSRIEALKALLSFNTYDYFEAKKYAEKSIEFAVKAETNHTLSSFIYAVCLLYEEKPNHEELLKHFKYSVAGEPDNPLIPKMFKIITDRMVERLYDGSLDFKVLHSIFEIASIESIKKAKVENYAILIIKYVMMMKHEDEKIVALMTTENKALKNSPKRTIACKKSFEAYGSLLLESKIILSILQQEAKRLNEKEIIDNVNILSNEVMRLADKQPQLEKMIYGGHVSKKGKTNISDIVVSFGVIELNINEDGDEPLYADTSSLGFDCVLENEIILKIGHYEYHYDENEKECLSKEKEEILRWRTTGNIFEADKKYSVFVKEIDMVSDDDYTGDNIVLTADDIRNINDGKIIRKSIGIVYFVEFSKE